MARGCSAVVAGCSCSHSAQNPSSHTSLGNAFSRWLLNSLNSRHLGPGSGEKMVHSRPSRMGVCPPDECLPPPCSNPEYKDTPMDIAQLPHLPEKTSESSETSDSESDSKDTSGITGIPPSPCSALTACLSKREGWAVAPGWPLEQSDGSSSMGTET